MSNFFKSLFKKGAGIPTTALSARTDLTAGGLQQRLQDIYGEQQIELQMCYERWVTRDSWLLKDEALPLLCGRAPGSDTPVQNPDQASAELDEMWQHARSCVEQGLLAVINREQADKDWRVRPLDVYRWAKISRMPLPDILSTLMDFVVSSIKPERTAAVHIAPGEEAISAHFDQNREMALGVALALLAAYPDRCRDHKGRADAGKILQLMEEKGSFLSGTTPVDFSSTAVRDIISKWLNTLPGSGPE